MKYWLSTVSLVFSMHAHASFDDLVEHVSNAYQVPEWVISSICIHESQSFYRGKRQAWPWTVNVGGSGSWWRSKGSAIRFVEEKRKQGKTNIDIGICQMNWFYHHQKFIDLNEMFDPVRNMSEAAKYVKQQKGNGTWENAIGRYHSPNNSERAKSYAKAVLSHRSY